MKTVVILFGIVFLIRCTEGFHLKDFEEEGEFEEVPEEDYPSVFLLEYFVLKLRDLVTFLTVTK